MRIAIPTTDRVTLFNRTGRTKEFAIYNIDNGSYDFIEFRENPHKHEEDEEDENHHDHSHSDVVKVLKDCDALLVKTVGQHFRKDLDKAGIPLYQTKQTELKEIITLFSLDMLSHKRL